MRPLARFVYEYRNLLRVLPGDMAWRLLTVTACNAATVLRSRRMTAVDAAMSCNCDVRYHGRRLSLPIADLDRATACLDDNPAFGNLREMFANDVYLRCFRRGLRADRVVDLGSNRGLFLVVAVKVLGAELAIGIEPETRYEEAVRLLCAANSIPMTAVRRLCAMVAPQDGPESVSMPTVLATLGGARINFLKCDIEGMEYPLFADGASWLARVDNLAMEVHPDYGDNRRLVADLHAAGFACLATDRFGAVLSDPAGAEFIYASSVGDLSDGCHG